MKNRNGVLETTLDNILTNKCWYIVYNVIIILRFVSILFLIYAMYCIWSISKLFLRTTSFHLANTAWSHPVRRESSPSPAGVDGARRSSLLFLLLAHGDHCYTCSSQGAFMFHFLCRLSAVSGSGQLCCLKQVGFLFNSMKYIYLSLGALSEIFISNELVLNKKIVRQKN